MSEITLRNICKMYDKEHYAVKDFNLSIHDKEFVIFVGPSGCGKSTTLRMIAGLEEISDGELWIDGEFCNYFEPKDRGMSMVFQDYALYPYMTVYDNLAFSLKIRKVPKNEIKETVLRVAKTLEIEHLLDRRPNALSGGQKQRVAIGSAIVRKPKAFLMDEPLSNLDAKLRTQMRVELAKLHKDLDATIIYVTHDQTEAMTLGTRIVVMKDGIVQQVDAPAEIYRHPVNLFVAGFIGSPSMNFFDAFVGVEDGKTTVYLGNDKSAQRIYLNEERAAIVREKEFGKRVILGIRPEDIYTYETAVEEGFEYNSEGIEVKIDTREMLGAEVILYFDEQNKTHAVRLKPDNTTKPGERITLYFDPSQIHIFDADTQENIFYGKEEEA
ncbi:MAG: ABC transporter ATP-binding protein [Lachnospiraceae bacterium]